MDTLLSLIQPDVILACLLTGKYDVNRNTTWQANDYTMMAAWAESVIRQGLQGIVFHNHFSEEVCQKYQNEQLQFVRITAESPLNPNVYRYCIYTDFLEKYGKEIKNLFVTDIADVVLLHNPFEQDFYHQHAGFVFCGDEPKLLNDEWMKAHNAHLRSKIEDFADFEANFEDAPLLNCGIIGGQKDIMAEFLKKLAHLHLTYNSDNSTAYTGDMGAFNYLAYTQYQGLIKHGFPINTQFKGYETHRKDCWFRHK